MPSRVLREGIITSIPVNSLSCQAEVFYRRLMSIVDDYGRYHAHPALLRAACYPLQLEKVGDSDVGKWLLATAKAGLVRVYSVQDKDYLEIVNFRQQTRSTSKFPENNCLANAKQMQSGCAPNAESEAQSESKAEAHSEASASVSAGRAEKSGKPPIFPPGLLRFWELLPEISRDRSSRKDCLKVWIRDGLEDLVDLVCNRLEFYKSSAKWVEDAGKYIPGAHRWLDKRKWEEKPEEAKSDIFEGVR